MTDLTGSNLGRYQIIERLGQGGMATVYKAYDTRLEREVAIKTIRTDMFPPAVLPDVLARFEREAKALARLDHPNIVRVHDYGEHDNVPFLVMAYVTGGSLRERTGRVYPPREAVAILAPVARALDYAHSMGILHRDIKPANILINARGVPLLSDFGIAKILDADNSQGLTATGMAIGTPEYMAPEQSSGDKVDSRADIYALGVVLFELLSGRRPFEGNTPIDVMIKTRTAPLPTLGSLGLQVPPEVEIIVQRALARETAERYATMDAFAQDLETVLGPTTSTLTSENLKQTTPSSPASTPFASPVINQPFQPDSGRTITNPTPLPIPPATVDSGRTITTPPPSFAAGSEVTTVAPPSDPNQGKEGLPQRQPPPPPFRRPEPPSTQDLQAPGKRPGICVPAWAFGVLGLLVVLLVGGGIWAVNKPGAPAVEPTATTAQVAVEPTATIAQVVFRKITISIWDTWSDDLELEATRVLLTDYQAAHPGLTIELSRPTDQDTLTALLSDSGPDILINSNENLGALAQGLFAISQNGITPADLRSRLSPVAVGGVIWRDQVWGIPLAQNSIAIVYNKDLVTPLDFPQDSNDIDGLIKRAFDFKRRTGKYLVCNPGFSNGDAYFVAPVFFSMGMPGFVNENGEVFVNTQAGREAGRLLKAWRLTAGPQDVSYDTCKTMFQNGEAGSWWIGPWEKDFLRDPARNLAVARFGKPFVTLRTAALTQNALKREHVKQALDIINHLTLPESQVYMALEAFSIPTAEAAITSPELRNLPLITGFYYAGSIGVPISPSPFTTAQWEPVGAAISKIWNGDQLPTEALAIAQKVILEAIEKMR